MQIGEIWKHKQKNEFIEIDCFVKDYNNDSDLKIVIKTLRIIDMSLAYGDFWNYVATQEQIEEDYEFYCYSFSEDFRSKYYQEIYDILEEEDMKDTKLLKELFNK